MRVQMRFVPRELFQNIPDGSFEFQIVSTIYECVERYAADHGVTIHEDWTKKYIIMQNNKPVQISETATDGADITVLHTMMGG